MPRFRRDDEIRKVQAMSDAGGKNFIDLTANIVSAYLSNNPTPASEIPALIGPTRRDPQQGRVDLADKGWNFGRRRPKFQPLSARSTRPCCGSRRVGPIRAGISDAGVGLLLR